MTQTAAQGSSLKPLEPEPPENLAIEILLGMARLQCESLARVLRDFDSEKRQAVIKSAHPLLQAYLLDLVRKLPRRAAPEVTP